MMRLVISFILLFSVTVKAADFDDVGANAELEAEALLQTAATESVTTPEAPKAEAPALAVKENLQETEIPLNLDNKKKAQAEDSSLFRILFTLSILGVLGTGAFFFIRKYQVPRAAKHQTQIKVLQQHFLGPKKSLAIIRVAGESILIGVTEHNISMIKSLSLLDDEVPEQASENFETVLDKQNQDDFSADLEAYSPKKAMKKKAKSSKESDLDDEFAISGIKDIVSNRLKGMRSFQ